MTSTWHVYFWTFCVWLSMCSDSRPRFSNNWSFWWPIIIRSAGTVGRLTSARTPDTCTCSRGVLSGSTHRRLRICTSICGFFFSPSPATVSRNVDDKRLHRKHNNIIISSSSSRLNHNDDVVYIRIITIVIYGSVRMRSRVTVGLPGVAYRWVNVPFAAVQGNVPTPHDSSVVMSERARVACALHTGKRSPLQGHCPTPSTPTYLLFGVFVHIRAFTLFFFFPPVRVRLATGKTRVFVVHSYTTTALAEFNNIAARV